MGNLLQHLLALCKKRESITYPCPVCGYHMDDPADDYNICPCCGTEFGYEDSGRTHTELRQIWLNAGARWWSLSDKRPKGWNPYVQLADAGFGLNK